MMGVFGDGDQKKSKSRGKTNVGGALAGLGTPQRSAGGADWSLVDPGWIAAVVVEVTRRGGAATFGTSRDKGAYSCTLFLGDDRRTVWINGGDDVNGELEKIFEVLRSIPIG